jgi:hypothetical protein
MTTYGKNPNYVPAMNAVMSRSRAETARFYPETNMIEWGDWSRDAPRAEIDDELRPLNEVFTPEEIEALKRSHGSANVNWQRAAAVKKAMGEGFDTISKLEERFKGTWKKTQISIDKAALVEAQSR